MAATYTVGTGKTYAWNQTAINAMPGNLAGQGIQTLETYAGGVDIGTGYRYDENLDFNAGFSNESALNHIEANAMVANQGKPGYGIIINKTTSGIVITPGPYMKFTGYCLTCAGTNSWDYGWHVTSTKHYTTCKDCIAYNMHTTSGASADAVGFSLHTGTNNKVINCMAVDLSSTQRQAVGFYMVAGSNNLVYNCSTCNISCTATTTAGFYFNNLGAGCEVKNCVAMDSHGGSAANRKDFYKQAGNWPTITYCISSDDSADDAGGVGNLINKTAADQFVSIVVGAENLHLKLGSNCINVGTDLSGAGVVDDIDGTARPQYGACDVGADEFDGLVPTVSGSETIDDNNENIMIEPIPRPIEAFLAFDISNLNNNLDDFDIIISAWGPLGDSVIGHYNITSDGVDITIAENGAAGVVTQNRKIELDHISVFQAEGIHIQRIRNSAIDRDIDMDYYFTTKQMVA